MSARESVQRKGEELDRRTLDSLHLLILRKTGVNLPKPVFLPCDKYRGNEPTVMFELPQADLVIKSYGNYYSVELHADVAVDVNHLKVARKNNTLFIRIFDAWRRSDGDSIRVEADADETSTYSKEIGIHTYGDVDGRKLDLHFLDFFLIWKNQVAPGGAIKSLLNSVGLPYVVKTLEETIKYAERHIQLFKENIKGLNQLLAESENLALQDYFHHSLVSTYLRMRKIQSFLDSIQE